MRLCQSLFFDKKKNRLMYEGSKSTVHPLGSRSKRSEIEIFSSLSPPGDTGSSVASSRNLLLFGIVSSFYCF